MTRPNITKWALGGIVAIAMLASVFVVSMMKAKYDIRKKIEKHFLCDVQKVSLQKFLIYDASARGTCYLCFVFQCRMKQFKEEYRSVYGWSVFPFGYVYEKFPKNS